jgi:hypothetical protein
VAAPGIAAARAVAAMALAAFPPAGALAGLNLVRGQDCEGSRQCGQELEQLTPRTRRGKTHRDSVEAIAVHARSLSIGDDLDRTSR